MKNMLSEKNKKAQKAEADAEDLYSITQLAGELGISTRTIRFYESKDLLSPDRVGNTRIFRKRDRARLLLILRGKRLGFSLRDISEYLSLYDADETQANQMALLRAKVDERLALLEGQMLDLQTTISELNEIRELAAPVQKS